MSNQTVSSATSPSEQSRRQFMKLSAAGLTGFTILPRHVLGGSGYTAPSDRLSIAMIGTGGRGMNNLAEFLRFEDVEVVAIADVTEEADYSAWYYNEPGGRGPGIKRIRREYKKRYKEADHAQCQVFTDFRVMLDKVKSADGIVVSIPDHTHAIAVLAAIDLGKHVYVEKPMARTIAEVRKMTVAAREAGIVSQMGIQGHAGEGLRMTAEWLQDGAIGAVHEIMAWSDHVNTCGCREGVSPGHYDIPAGLDWDLWLGPAKKRPYHPNYTPAAWRDFWDFGTGKIGDMGCHNMDPAFYALNLGYPEWVEGRGAWGDSDKRPFTSMITFRFPERGDQPAVKMTWYSGIIPPRPEELEPGRDLTGGGNGILFIGDKGKMMCGGWAGTPRLIPEKAMKKYTLPEKRIPRVKGGHHRDWVDAIKEGRKAGADFEYAGPMTEVVLTGNVALRLGERLYWDGPKMKAVNSKSAEKFIHPEYHNGWKL